MCTVATSIAECTYLRAQLRGSCVRQLGRCEHHCCSRSIAGFNVARKQVLQADLGAEPFTSMLVLPRTVQRRCVFVCSSPADLATETQEAKVDWVHAQNAYVTCWNLPRAVQRANELEECRTPGLRVRVSNSIKGRACARRRPDSGCCVPGHYLQSFLAMRAIFWPLCQTQGQQRGADAGSWTRGCQATS